MVSVGRLVPVKRFSVLIDALVSIKERHPALRAILIGESRSFAIALPPCLVTPFLGALPRLTSARSAGA